MSGDSMVKDLGEMLEFYGEHERLGIPAVVIARFMVDSLTAFRSTVALVRALPTTRNAEQEEKTENAGELPL